MSHFKVTLEFNTTRFMSAVRSYAQTESLRDIAEITGVSASTLSRLDNGHMPDMRTLIVLCEVADMKPGDYFERVEWTGKVLT